MGQTGQLPQNGQLIPKKAKIVDLFVHQFWTHSHIWGSEHGAQSHLKWVISMVRGGTQFGETTKNPKKGLFADTPIYIYIYTSLSNSSNIPAEATQVEQPSLLSVRRSATALQRMMVQVPIECLVKDVFPNGMWGFLAVALLLDLDMVFLGDRKLFCSIRTRWFLDVFLGLRRSNLNSVKAT